MSSNQFYQSFWPTFIPYMAITRVFSCYTFIPSAPPTHTHTSVPEPVYLLEGLLRVNMSNNLIKELSSLIDTWEKLVTLDVSFNQITTLHVSV